MCYRLYDLNLMELINIIESVKLCVPVDLCILQIYPANVVAVLAEKERLCFDCEYLLLNR